MQPNQIFAQIKQKKSFLCVGLDTALEKIPHHLKKHPNGVFEFNRQIIEATKSYAIAYKMNIAFYESLGKWGWEQLEKTLEIIPPNIFTIADAKRGDIGNTSKMYARTFFETYNFDSITVAPYMGKDSVAPFLEFPNKWVFLLALTSNPGGRDFQWYGGNEKPLFKEVIRKSWEWTNEFPGNLGYVVGATRSEYIQEVREMVPNAFLLVPGIGAQGGDLHSVCKFGVNKQGGLLINSSRGIIYAGQGEAFAQASKQSAQSLQIQMKQYIV